MLQEPMGLGLLEPSPGLGLQGLASLLRHLLSLSRVLWTGGGPRGLGRCLVRGGVQGGKVAMMSGPSPDSKPAATFSFLSPDPPGHGRTFPAPSPVACFKYNGPESASQGVT